MDLVETTPVEQGAASASNTQPTVPATTAAPVDLEGIRKAARLEAQREAQSKADQKEARLHKMYQGQLKELKGAASEKLRKVGYENPDSVFQDVEVLQKARAYDELANEANQAAEWNGYVASTAEGFGLDASDPRLQGASSAADLIAKGRAAVSEDARKFREQAMKDADEAHLKAAAAKVENGDLDTLGGAPSAPAASDEANYKKEMQAARGKGMAAGRAIKDKWRAKGVNVDYLPLT